MTGIITVNTTCVPTTKMWQILPDPGRSYLILRSVTFPPSNRII